jgi:hypothetical protein
MTSITKPGLECEPLYRGVDAPLGAAIEYHRGACFGQAARNGDRSGLAAGPSRVVIELGPARAWGQALIVAATDGAALLRRHCSMLTAPAPKAAIWSSPPAIITFFRKWIIWFWSVKLL